MDCAQKHREYRLTTGFRFDGKIESEYGGAGEAQDHLNLGQVASRKDSRTATSICLAFLPGTALQNVFAHLAKPQKNQTQLRKSVYYMREVLF